MLANRELFEILHVRGESRGRAGTRIASVDQTTTSAAWAGSCTSGRRRPEGLSQTRDHSRVCWAGPAAAAAIVAAPVRKLGQAVIKLL